ncbi:ankyrin repeat domain-containing protein [Mycoplasmatota bacterium zrk1]
MYFVPVIIFLIIIFLLRNNETENSTKNERIKEFNENSSEVIEEKLIKEINEDNLIGVKKFRDINLNINYIDQRGKTPIDHIMNSIFWCKVRGEHEKLNLYKEMLWIVIEIGVMSKIIPDDKSIIHKLFDYNMTDLIEVLISCGADINVLNVSRESLLHRSLKSEDIEFSVFLIKEGINVSVLDNVGKSPLYIALQKYFKSLNPKYYDIAVDLFMSTEFNEFSIEESKNILESIIVKLTYEDTRVSSNNRSKLVRLLLEKKDLYEIDLQKVNYLIDFALYGDDPQIILALLNMGVDVRLRYAFERGTNLNTLKAIIDHKRDFKHVVLEACLFCRLDVIEYMIERETDMNIVDQEGNSPLHIICDYHYYECEKGEDINILNLLLSSGIDPNLKNNVGDTPIHVACKSSENLSVVVVLVENGADINSKNFNGLSPLHYASISSDHSIIKYLGSQEANINCVDNKSNTCLHHHMSEVEKENINIVKALVKYGIYFNMVNNKGDTALSIATRRGFTKVVEYLLNIGGKIDPSSEEMNLVCNNSHLKSINNDRFKELDVEELDSLSGIDFEKYLQTIFTSMEYSVDLLPPTNDYGADLILYKNDKKIVVQAKRYSASVGSRAVQLVEGAKSYYRADEAWVVTTNYFTKNARKMAESLLIRLINRDELLEVILQNANRIKIYKNKELKKTTSKEYK